MAGTSKRTLHVQATGAATSATLTVYEAASGTLIGVLTNTGGGKFESQFPWSVNPRNVTVKSSLGGSATGTVTAK